MYNINNQDDEILIEIDGKKINLEELVEKIKKQKEDDLKLEEDNNE